MSTNRKITNTDLENAARLARVWRQKKDELNLTQEKLAEEWAVSQSTISQYLNGRIALNTDAVLRFAKRLEVSPLQIAPDLLEHLIGTNDPMAWIDVETFTPSDGTMYYAIDKADGKQRIVKYYANNNRYVCIHTRTKIEPLAVVPALPDYKPKAR